MQKAEAIAERRREIELFIDQVNTGGLVIGSLVILIYALLVRDEPKELQLLILVVLVSLGGFIAVKDHMLHHNAAYISFLERSSQTPIISWETWRVLLWRKIFMVAADIMMLFAPFFVAWRMFERISGRQPAEIPARALLAAVVVAFLLIPIGIWVKDK